jgi:hypothetical protein
MGTSDKMSAEKAAQLADELSALSKQQSEALHKGAYISMSREEAKQYDQRRTRISEICTWLGKFKPLESPVGGNHSEPISLGDEGNTQQ